MSSVSNTGADLSTSVDTNSALKLGVPSVARMYDYYLGGKDNFAIDRERAEEVLLHAPMARSMARENRAFLGRVVRHLAEQGIRQFLDIGSGMPSAENVHEVAQRVAPESRVVYVDDDPVVLAHGRALLTDGGNTAVITADLRNPEAILTHSDFRRLIDPSLPIAVLMIAILHFIPDDDRPTEIVKTYRDWTPSGSYLAVSHADRRPELASAARVYDRASSRAILRSREEVTAFFGDWDLIDPGIVQLPAWRPYTPISPADVAFWGGIARKPGER